VRIDSSGNVGIGTTSPGTRLHVENPAASTTLRLGTTASAQYLDIFRDGATGAAVYNSAQAAPFRAHIWQLGGAEAMRITSAGDVGIGTTVPLSRFTVSQTGTSTISLESAGAWNAGVGVTSTGDLLFSNPLATERMRIDSSGNLSLGTTAGLARLRVASAAQVNAPVLGNVTNYPIFLSNPDTSYGLGAGVSAVDGRVWLQAQRSDSAVAYNITLNEAGGNVGIGTTSGIGKLGVAVTGSRTIGTAWDASSVLIGSPGQFSGNLGFSFDTTNGGTIESAAPGVAAYPVRLVGSDVRFLTALTERMRIDSSGNVGIGTTAPGSKLDVVAQDAIRITGFQPFQTWRDSNDSNKGFRIQTAGGNALFSNDATGGGTYTERARIDSSGNLLVGTTSTSGIPTGSSSNPGAFIESTGTLNIQRNNNNNIFLSKASGFTSGGFISFQVAGSQVGFIAESGGGTVYSTTSDVRLKHDIVDAPEASSLIDAMQVRSFKWNADDSEQRYGFIAQELVEVAPEAVSVPADEDAMMGVDYSKLVPMLVKEMQSMRARLAELEASASTITFQGN